jgi:hypothetical protein
MGALLQHHRLHHRHIHQRTHQEEEARCPEAEALRRRPRQQRQERSRWPSRRRLWPPRLPPRHSRQPVRNPSRRPTTLLGLGGQSDGSGGVWSWSSAVTLSVGGHTSGARLNVGGSTTAVWRRCVLRRLCISLVSCAMIKDLVGVHTARLNILLTYTCARLVSRCCTLFLLVIISIDLIMLKHAAWSEHDVHFHTTRNSTTATECLLQVQPLSLVIHRTRRPDSSAEPLRVLRQLRHETGRMISSISIR